MRRAASRGLAIPGSALLATSILAGCGAAAPPPGDSRFHVLQERIFDRQCAVQGCHSGYFPESRMSLERGLAWKSLVGARSLQQPGMLRVAPGRPDASYLIRKLEGVGITGEQMPNGRTPLSPAAIAAIRRWIEDGAPND